MTLGEFLLAAAKEPGPWNCSTLPADWCMSLGHPDFAAAWRDITDPGECETVAEDAGGLVELWRRGIGDALPVVDDLEPGDIGVIGTHGLEAGAIFAGKRWAFRMSRGVVSVPVERAAIVRVWRPR